MILKDKIRMVLREHYGEFETYLEHEYEIILTEHLFDDNMEKKRAWATYNQVILELKNTLKDMLRVEELQYRLTEESNPNEVCMSVIEDIKDKSPELSRLYDKILNF